MKQLCSIFIISLIFSCNINKEVISDDEKYICLSAESIGHLNLNYKLKIPEDWCVFREIHGELTYSPKSKDLQQTYYKNNLSVFAFNAKKYKSKNIQEALEKHIIKDLSSYEPILTSGTHSLYGKYYMVKERYFWNNEPLIYLKVLYNYNNQDYLIVYSVLEKDYEVYIDQVLNIMESFEIVG